MAIEDKPADVDHAKALRNPELRRARLAAIEQPHVAPLTAFVRQLRAEMGPEYAIPYFDPADGGIHAAVLYLLEAPGSRAVASGFISRDNPDETAKNFLLMNREAGVDRVKTVIWNVVPWYIGSGTRIRKATLGDTVAGAASLERVLALLPQLHAVVFLGAHAAKARNRVLVLRPAVATFAMPHPSPMFVNRAPGNRNRLLTELKQMAACLEARSR